MSGHWVSPKPKNPEPGEPGPPPPIVCPAATGLLYQTYSAFRFDGEDFEELLGSLRDGVDGFTEHDLKRLDKAAVLLNVGFKLVKKVLKRHGYQTARAKPSPVKTTSRATP